MQYKALKMEIYQTKGMTLTEQYFDVGALFGESIRKTVKSIARRTAKKSLIRKQVAERTFDNLRNNPLAKEFVECLAAWAQGAQISSEQAMWLMADNLTGCQTVIVKYKTGMGLLHTEEDFEDMSLHMTGEKIVSFNDRGNKSSCLVYNDLMPGAGLYGWKKDLIVAVDTLFLKEDGIEQIKNPMLANVIAWMMWRMSPVECEPSKVLELLGSLGELVDGYAINVIRKVDSRIEGYKMTLARSESRTEYVDQNIGSYLRQVNIVDPSYPPMTYASPARNIWRGGYKYFLGRLATIDEHLSRYRNYLGESIEGKSLRQVHTGIQKTIYTELHDAYINENVGAVCIGFVDELSTSVSCKLNDGQTFNSVEYMDICET